MTTVQRFSSSPNHVVYGKVQLSDVPDIVEGLRSGVPVQRLVVAKG
ncbi:MAG: hypothetical protein QM784_02735 [Polyangiaceae bacterium]